MQTAEAIIHIEDPERYLTRLRGHTGKMGTPGHKGGIRLGHRPRRHDGADPPEIRHAEWSATTGTVTMNWGQWTAHASEGTLKLHAEAADAANLRSIQDMLTTRLENFGRRDRLSVTWRPSAGPAETG